MSTRTLWIAAFAVLASVGTAIAGSAVVAGSGPKPAAKALDQALLEASTAKAPAGITARISFTNNLIASGLLGERGGIGGSPILTGATGRLWASPTGIRLELQSSGGDAQIVVTDGVATVYDAATATVYRFTMPAHAAATKPAASHTPPTLASIDAALARLATSADISGATPTDVAGEPAYSVRLSPSHDGGLLGQLEAAWDANHGIPLRVGIYARGASSPVLELAVTDIAYAPVPDSLIAIAPPAGAKVVDLSAGQHAAAADSAEAPASTTPAGALTLAMPATLVGLPRTTQRPIDWKGSPAELTVYGKGLGALVVITRKADAAPAGATKGRDANPLAALPTISLGTVQAQELPTALGTILVAEKGGVTYLILGSLPPVAAEAAARALLG